MTDEAERPEDAARRFAHRVVELEAKLSRYREAIELWDALDLRENQQVVSATLLAKLQDFENNTVAISTAVTDGCDWIEQIGLINTAMIIVNQTNITRDDDDDD